jgi:hypothetical protein
MSQIEDGLKVKKLDGKQVILPGDRLHEPITNLLVLLAGLSFATSVLVDSTTHKLPNPIGRVQTRWPDYGFLLPMGNVLQNMLSNKIAPLIEIGIMADPVHLAEPMPKVKIEASFVPLTPYLMGPVFLAFFEPNIEWLNREPAHRHPTLDFGRVIRNAVAHHGKILFKNQKAESVSWRDLTYGPGDNGRRVIGTDLHMGEIIALMFDCDDVLTALGAPIG